MKPLNSTELLNQIQEKIEAAVAANNISRLELRRLRESVSQDALDQENRVSGFARDSKRMIAKYASTCALTGDAIEIGETIYYDRFAKKRAALAAIVDELVETGMYIPSYYMRERLEKYGLI